MNIMRFVGVLFVMLFANVVLADWVNMNTGINDNLTGVVFWDDYGIVSGKHGLYYTTDGGSGPGSWNRYNISGNTGDSVIYNNTQFTHCFSDRYDGDDIVFACGQDTINNKSVIMRIDFPSMNYTMVHIGPGNTSLNKIGCNTNMDKYYAVGDNGLIISFSENSGTIIDTVLPYDLYSIDFYWNNFWIASDSVNIFGEDSYSGINYTLTSADSNIYKDISFTAEAIAFAVGNGYYRSSNQQVTEYNNYDFGELNGRCVTSYWGNMFVGTDHGIFRAEGTYWGGTVLEWQPSSYTYEINEFWSELGGDYFYACGDEGVLLRTDDYGGPTKPYASLSLEGGCVDNSILISGETGTSTDCKWFIDDDQVHWGCDNFWHYFDSLGMYTVKVQVSNDYGYGDTAIQQIHIVEIPEIDKPVTISDDILCHKEEIIITIDSSQYDVFYRFRKYDEYGDYGHSNPGNGGTISFTTDSLNTVGNYYIEAMSSLANCSDDFTDTIFIDVEYTKSQFHFDKMNIVPEEPINFYEQCTDAQNYLWEFSESANILTSNSSEVQNYFTTTDSTTVKLICWSDYGCYDTTITPGPTVYIAPGETDSCWTNLNDSNDPAWAGYYSPDIAHISQSTNGFLTCGYFHDMSLATQLGSNINLRNKAGGYMAKYNSDGVVKWITHSVQKSDNREYVKSIVEDNNGNIYICGFTYDDVIDNKGDTINIGSGYYFHGYIMKLDSLGRNIWTLSGRKFSPGDLIIDNSNNLIVSASIYDEDIPLLLNGIPVDTIAKVSPDCNYSIIKVLEDGSIDWDAGLDLEATNGHEITKVGVDSLNDIYVTGIYEHSALFYSANSGTGNHLAGFVGNYGGKLFLAKYNSEGILQWKTRSYTVGPPNDRTVPMDMWVDNAGNSYISGRNNCTYFTYNHKFESVNGTSHLACVGEYYILKVNSEGVCQWIQGNSNSYYGFGHNVTGDGNEIYVIGQVSNNDQVPETTVFSSADGSSIEMTIQKWDYFLAVYDTSGNLIEMHKNGDNDEGVNDYGFSGLIKSNDGCFYSARNMNFFNNHSNYNNFGTIIPTTNERDGLVTKFIGSCGITYYPTPVSIENHGRKNKGKIYPNPTSDILTIDGIHLDDELVINIFDISGNMLSSSKQKQSINLKNLSSGLYFVLVFDKNNLILKEKIIKQ